MQGHILQKPFLQWCCQALSQKPSFTAGYSYSLLWEFGIVLPNGRKWTLINSPQCTMNLLPNLSLGDLSPAPGAHHSQGTPQGCQGHRDLFCHMCRALSHPLFHANICCRNVTVHNTHLPRTAQKEEKHWILAYISFFKNHGNITNWVVPLGGNISCQMFMRAIYFCHLYSHIRDIW